MTTTQLEEREISPGVVEVYDNGHQIGLITFNPTPMCATYFASYANGDDTIPYRSRPDALAALRLQHNAVQRFVRSLRSIRPATGHSQSDYSQLMYDRGYNQALRDVERLAQEVVGQAPEGEGYTAITRGALTCRGS